MSRPMTERMLGALRLDEATYEEVEADQKATGEAAFIVVATSLVNGAVNGVFTGVSGGFIGALGSLVACVFEFVFGLPAITLLVGLWVPSRRSSRCARRWTSRPAAPSGSLSRAHSASS